MARPRSSKVKRPNWLELPPEVMATILVKIGAIEILTSAQKVCTSWWKICKDPLMWRSIDMHKLEEFHIMSYNLVIMAKHAIDRSCGGLVEISIESFGTDELLEYISRTTQLRSLQLVYHFGMISDEALSAAASKLPLLVELDLTLSYFSKETLETVGRCCPLLKSFKYNCLVERDPDITDIECNKQALAIAENMPGLRHLQLIGNNLRSDGLQAILDGCPHLISLDLRLCLNINLAGDLGKRCAEQIKEFQHPIDSTHDYGFATGAELEPDYWGPSSDGEYHCGFSNFDSLSDDENDDDDDDDHDYDDSDEAELDDMKKRRKRRKEMEDEAAEICKMLAKVEMAEYTSTGMSSQVNKEEVDCWQRGLFMYP